MHRIDKRGHVNNRFSVGNPGAGQPPTVVGADWPNAVQEELAHVIEQAGLVLTKEDNTQLYQALIAIVAGTIGEPGEEGSVPTTRLVSTSGLLTGGGALVADLTIGLAKASGIEVAAGVDDTKAITPAGLAAAMSAVKSTTGYVKMLGGIIIMWGQATSTGNATTVITLPTTFPTACAFASCSGGASSPNAQDNNPFVAGRGVGSISIYSAVDSASSINWLAIGY